jgi:hypothetical protein
MNALCKYLAGVISVVVLAFASVTDVRADFMITNGSFQTANPNYTSTPLTGSKDAGYSAAANWGTWNNTSATTSTQLLPSTFPGGSSTNMIHVETTGTRNGIVQVFAPKNGGATNVLATAYVYVLSGHVSLGTGNGGDTTADVVSKTTNHWERLQAYNGISPANELIVYSSGGAANYYVAYASISVSSGGGHTAGVPEPSALLLSMLGVFFTAVGKSYRRKRKSKIR